MEEEKRRRREGEKEWWWRGGNGQGETAEKESNMEVSWRSDRRGGG